MLHEQSLTAACPTSVDCKGLFIAVCSFNLNIVFSSTDNIIHQPQLCHQTAMVRHPSPKKRSPSLDEEK